MARPRVFVSSTYYDLKHLRSSLENFVESLGFDAVLSEKGQIAYTPDIPLGESCYREVGNADVFVLIVGGRYGSESSQNKSATPKTFYDRYNSVTKGEYKSAVERDIPVYILVERGVYAEYQTFLKNKENKAIVYAHVDSVNVFELIENILSQSRNNPVQQFEKYIEIESWLREQWAGLFRELLQSSKGQKQISSLQSQVGQLSELNTTFKAYLEEIVSKIAPGKSKQLIDKETKRLKEATVDRVLSDSPLGNYLESTFGREDSIAILRMASWSSLNKKLFYLAGSNPTKVTVARDLTTLPTRRRFLIDLNEMRKRLNLPLLKMKEADEDDEGVDAMEITKRRVGAKRKVSASKSTVSKKTDNSGRITHQ